VASATSIAQAYEAGSGRTVAGAADVFALAADDEVARSVVTEAIAALADGLAGLVQLTAPARIVLGGGLADAGEVWLDPLRAALGARCRVVAAPPLVAARFGARAGVVGAALLARRGPIDVGGAA
jgi:glucokinase